MKLFIQINIIILAVTSSCIKAVSHTSSIQPAAVCTSCEQQLSSNSEFSITSNADLLDQNRSEGLPCFVFFYSTGCQHCAAARGYIDNDLEDEIGMPFRYEAYEVHSGYARDLLLGYQNFDWKGEKAVPTVFLGSSDEDMTILVGDKDIILRLPSLLKSQNENLKCYDFTKLEHQPELAASVSNINWGMITAAAFVDSINPCAIAVLVILLSGLVVSIVPQNHEKEHQQHSNADEGAKEVAASTNKPPTSPSLEKSVHTATGSVLSNNTLTLAIEVGAGSMLDQVEENAGLEEDIEAAEHPENNVTTGSESQQNRQARRAFLSGMAFISSIFISYYLLGFGLFSAVSATGVSDIIYLVLGIFIVILGLWNIKDFFCYDRGFNVEIPRAWRPLLKRILGAVASPIGAFAAGFLVSLFELPCSGGPYLFILGLLADKNTRAEAAVLLLYYCFIFVLPLICINCLVYFGVTRIQKVGNWKDKYIRHLHLAVGLILVALGCIAVADYFRGVISDFAN